MAWASREKLIEKTLKDAARILQSERAKLPRERGLDHGGGKSFVLAVKKESKKQKSHTALAWLKANVDKVFAGFDVVSCDGDCVKFKYQGKEKPSISVDTFGRYWPLPDKSE